MPVLVDSSVLLDFLTEDKRWFRWSCDALIEAAETERLVINPIVYSEISIRFSHMAEVDEAVPASMFDREPVPYEAAFLAGKAFMRYRQRGGRRLRPLPDFLIGAHAVVAGYDLLTRDPGRHRALFPELRLITPR
jgi:predicted nucleic acid-binding protein